MQKFFLHIYFIINFRENTIFLFNILQKLLDALLAINDTADLIQIREPLQLVLLYPGELPGLGLQLHEVNAAPRHNDDPIRHPVLAGAYELHAHASALLDPQPQVFFYLWTFCGFWGRRLCGNTAKEVVVTTAFRGRHNWFWV